MRLADHAYDQFSQFGEDGMVEHIFSLIGEKSRFCVEFGASDGTSCSNTKKLRRLGWSALLIEIDEGLYTKLVDVAGGHQCILGRVTPGNINHYLAGRDVDFMSIDVDGDDYAIFEALEANPRVVCIEYNASIPPHVSLRQGRLGAAFGASALALCDLATSKGYALLEVTKGNLIFVLQEDVRHFAGYERNLATLFDPAWLSYVATDYAGHPVVVGNIPPWGLQPTPFVDALIGAGSEVTYIEGTPVTFLDSRLDALRRGFEELYGPSVCFPLDFGYSVEQASGPFVESLAQFLRATSTDLILIDISNQQLTATFDWVRETAEKAHYGFQIVPGSAIVLYRTRNNT